MAKLTQNQTILIIVVVLAAVVVAGYLVQKTQPAPSVGTTANTQPQTPSSGTQGVQTSTATGNTVSMATALSYNDALKIYAGRRIQFDASCQVYPYYNTFKNGTKVMLDNRLNQGRTVYLNDVQYYLGPYGFRIIALSTANALPYTIMIDCGTGKNNGTIVLH